MLNRQLADMVIIFSSLFFLSCGFITSTAGQAPAWKGKIETIGGVKVIKNPAEPLYGEFIPQLEEDLSIGDEKDETYYFPKGAALSVDDEDNLYVSDFGNRRVQKYDKNGKYIRTIGRQGQGPGEYMFPVQVFFDAEGDPCVRGARDLNFFTKDGAFKKKVVIKAPLTWVMLGPGNTIFGTTQPSPRPEGGKYEIQRLDSEGDFDRSIAEFLADSVINKNVYIVNWYSPGIRLISLTSETFAYGYSDEYKIYLADGEGRPVLVMTKEEKPQSISGREKEETRKGGLSAWAGNIGDSKPEDLIKFPDHRPYFSNFMADEEGRLYVMSGKSILDKSPTNWFDVFSKSGLYLYRMKLDFRPFVIRNGAIYEIRTNEETGDIKIIRHKVKNWDQFKTGQEIAPNM
jgi:hypothetical protein